MAYTAVATVVTGQTYLASDYNTYIKDNMAALWPYTTAGDLSYASSATSLARLGIGGTQTLLQSNGSAPAWVYLSTISQNQALVPSQAAGDLFYASSGTVITKLAKGTALQQLRMNAGATAPEWATIDAFPAGGTAYQGVRQNSGASAKEWAALLSLLGRQGGSDTDWSAVGTTNRSLANALVQTGAINVSSTSSPPAATVTFPVAYAYPPIVFLSLGTPVGVGVAELSVYNITASNFDIAYRLSSGSLTSQINWMALGPK